MRGMGGSGIYAYWGRSGQYKSGDPSSDKHIPFNPILNLDLPFIGYEQERETTADQLIANIIYDKELTPGVVSLETRFRDPILLAAMFLYKGLPAAWAGDGTDVMTFNFSNFNDKDNNLWMQVHVPDKSLSKNHLNLLYDGGQIVHYEWLIQPGKPLIELCDIEFVELSENTQPVNIDDGFDDGGFNLTGAAEVSTIVAVIANDIDNNDYFTMQGISAAWVRTDYHVWFNKDAGGVDPAPAGSTPIVVAITTGETAQQVSDLITAAIDLIANFGAANGAGTSTTITVTNANQGDVQNIADFNSDLVVATTTEGEIDQDGGWSNWDGGYDGSGGEIALSKDCTITFATAAVSGLDIEECRFIVDVPKELQRVQSSLTVNDFYFGSVDFHVTLSGILTGNNNFSEFLAEIGSKTTGIFRIQYGTTKYLQFTNAYYKKVDPMGELPPAGESARVTYEIFPSASSVLTYYWTATETTDPSDHITHTNV